MVRGKRQYVSLMGLLLKKFRGLLSKNNFRGLFPKNNIGKIPCQYLDKEFLISLFCKSRKYSRNRLKHMCCLLTFERKHRPYFIQRLLFHLKKYVFAYSPNYDNWISDYVHATYKT